MREFLLNESEKRERERERERTKEIATEKRKKNVKDDYLKLCFRAIKKITQSNNKGQKNPFVYRKPRFKKLKLKTQNKTKRQGKRFATKRKPLPCFDKPLLLNTYIQSKRYKHMSINTHRRRKNCTSKLAKVM